MACCKTFTLIRCLPPVQNLLKNQLATTVENGHMVFSSTLQTGLLEDIAVFIELHTPKDTSREKKKNHNVPG